VVGEDTPDERDAGGLGEVSCVPWRGRFGVGEDKGR